MISLLIYMSYADLDVRATNRRNELLDRRARSMVNALDSDLDHSQFDSELDDLNDIIDQARHRYGSINRLYDRAGLSRHKERQAINQTQGHSKALDIEEQFTRKRRTAPKPTPRQPEQPVPRRRELKAAPRPVPRRRDEPKAAPRPEAVPPVPKPRVPKPEPEAIPPVPKPRASVPKPAPRRSKPEADERRPALIRKREMLYVVHTSALPNSELNGINLLVPYPDLKFSPLVDLAVTIEWLIRVQGLSRINKAGEEPRNKTHVKKFLKENERNPVVAQLKQIIDTEEFLKNKANMTNYGKIYSHVKKNTISES